MLPTPEPVEADGTVADGFGDRGNARALCVGCHAPDGLRLHPRRRPPAPVRDYARFGAVSPAELPTNALDHGGR